MQQNLQHTENQTESLACARQAYLGVSSTGGRRRGLLKVNEHAWNAVTKIHLVVGCQRLVFLELYVLRRQHQLQPHAWENT